MPNESDCEPFQLTSPPQPKRREKQKQPDESRQVLLFTALHCLGFKGSMFQEKETTCSKSSDGTAALDSDSTTPTANSCASLCTAKEPSKSSGDSEEPSCPSHDDSQYDPTRDLWEPESKQTDRWCRMCGATIPQEIRFFCPECLATEPLDLSWLKGALNVETTTPNERTT